MRKLLAFLAALLAVGAPTYAYVDLAPTLARVMRESQLIAVVEVEKFNRPNGGLILKKVQELKGQTTLTQFRHQVAIGATVPRAVLEWAVPGQRGVLFSSNATTLVCMGRSWYEVAPSSDGWAKLAPDRPDLALGYSGTVSRLTQAVADILAGKTAIITTMPHGAESEGASFDVALNRAALPGMVRLQRMKANLSMGNNVMQVSANPMYVVGLGQAGEEDLPERLRQLTSPDPTTRAEAADDLGSLGPRAAAAIAPLGTLLADDAAQVRANAAAALLRIDPHHAPAMATLARDLASPDPTARRLAARAVGFVGAPAAPLVARLTELLADPEELVRVAALQSIATLGPAATAAFDAVVKLLDDPAARIDAADALGRMGPAARPAMKKLAELLTATSTPVQWAGVRAMCQIGGPDSGPVVDYIIRQLQNFTEWDGYNMMVYLCLLGPDAEKVLPILDSTRIKNSALRLCALWLIKPERGFPWQFSGQITVQVGERDWQRWVFENCVVELGDRLKPHARTLAEKVIAGTAGTVPTWGYRLLVHHPDVALPILLEALKAPDTVQRQRAIVALGYMGNSALPARAALEAGRATAEGSEARLIAWCLKEIGATD
jgi:HEAT repeat protein